MIKEIAVEPEVMANWNHFRDIWADCGVSRGRLLVEYPPDWRETVCRRAFEVNSTKAAGIMVRLKPGPGQTDPKRWIPTNRSYDKGREWLANAERHEPPNAFDVIVARANPRSKSRVVVAGDFPKDQPPWKTGTQSEVPRTAAGLVSCAGCLLRVSTQLVMVDQNFDAREPRFLEPFKAFVCARPKWQRCELHVAHPMANGRPDKQVLENRIYHMKQQLAPVIPTGCTLRVRFWYRRQDGKRLHPRFVMTEYGGLQYDYGLDEGDSTNDTTIVSLMDADVWQTVRADYGLVAGTAPAFDTGNDCLVEISGTA